MPHQFRQLDVRDLPRVFGAEGVPVAVEHDSLPTLRTDFGTVTETVHFPHQAVFRVGLPELIEEDVISRRVRLAGQPEELPSGSRKRNDS